MTRLAGVHWLGLLLVAGCATTPGSAQTNGSDEPVVTAAVESEPEAGEDLTIWDGVYTVAQAERGAETAQASCFACHSANEWENPMFIRVWSGRPIHGMWENLRMTMPYDAPGRLTAQEYSDIVAYMLELNDVPAGEVELPATPEGLQAIEVTTQD